MNCHTLAFYTRLAKLADIHFTTFYNHTKDIVVCPCSKISPIGKK